MTIRLLDEADAEALLELRIANRDFLTPYGPEWPDDSLTIDAQRARIAESGSYGWLILDDGEPAGSISLSHIVRGALQCATVGYWIDKRHFGRGLATAALAEVVEYAFGELGLHRLEAGTLVDNIASQRVLEKNGFERFGLARRYLLIGGDWHDHVLFERVAD